MCHICHASAMNIENFGKKFDALADQFIEELYALYAPTNFIAANVVIPFELKRLEKEANETLDAVKKMLSAYKARYHALVSEFSELTQEQRKVRVERKRVQIFKDLTILTERMRFFSIQHLTTMSEYDASFRNKKLEEDLTLLSKITADDLFDSWVND